MSLKSPLCGVSLKFVLYCIVHHDRRGNIRKLIVIMEEKPKLKEYDPPTLHHAPLLLLLSGNSLYSIPYLSTAPRALRSELRKLEYGGHGCH